METKTREIAAVLRSTDSYGGPVRDTGSAACGPADITL